MGEGWERGGRGVGEGWEGWDRSVTGVQEGVRGV